MNVQSSIRQNVTFSEYEPLAVALFVRDCLGLPQLVQVPRLDPGVALQEAASDREIDQLNDEWLTWWDEIADLTVESFRDVGAPIDYISLMSTKPSLKALAQPLVEEAKRWHETNRDTSGSLRQPSSPDFLPALALKLAHSVPGRKQRPAYSNLAFAVLPLETKFGWKLRPSLYAISKTLVSDRAGFETWFRSELAK